jgi:hypothetical protein
MNLLDMTPKLEPLRHALCALSDEALIALRHAAIKTRYLAPSFTAWIKHIVDWELDRRAGAHYFMLFPEELVHPHEFVRGAQNALTQIAATLAESANPGKTDELVHSLGQILSRCEQYR